MTEPFVTFAKPDASFFFTVALILFGISFVSFFILIFIARSEGTYIAGIIVKNIMAVLMGLTFWASAIAIISRFSE